MELLKLFSMVLLPILLEYGVQGVSFDYADPQDFKNQLCLGVDVTKLGENVTCKHGTGEKGSGKSKKMAITSPLSDNADDPTGRCPYGVTFQKDCNGCFCDPKTGETLCTVRGCELCAHGTKYTIDCNTCVCDERTGVTRCTRKKCRSGTFSNCIHGTHFMKDCNRCHCSMKTGQTVCTLMKCRTNKNKLAGKCPQGEYYSPDKCNMCHCDLLSGRSHCTLVYCGGEQVGQCPRGIRFSPYNDGCKNCRCNPNTGDIHCDRSLCLKLDEFKNVELSKEQSEIKGEQVGKCPHGINFSPEKNYWCKRCHCNPETGVSMCNNIYCSKEVAKNKNLKMKIKGQQVGKCPRGIRFSPYNDGCNNCRCNPNTGDILCDNSLCLKADEFKNVELSKEQLEIKDKPVGNCPDGIHFASDKNIKWCKDCRCDPKTGYTFCTSIGCSKGKIAMPSITQLAKNKNLKVIIKEAANGCTPPEVILIGSCRCDCRLPSVAVCKESCFLDSVG